MSIPVPQTPFAPLQRAIYARLSGDTELGTLVTGVFDETPETKDFPYITIGEMWETPRNWHGGFGQETAVTLHVWTKYRGFRQGDQIASRVTALLDHQPLTIEGFHTISVRREFLHKIQDVEPEIRHHILRFRITTEQADS